VRRWVLSEALCDWVLKSDSRSRVSIASREVSSPLRVFQRVPYRLSDSPVPSQRSEFRRIPALNSDCSSLNARTSAGLFRPQGIPARAFLQPFSQLDLSSLRLRCSFRDILPNALTSSALLASILPPSGCPVGIRLAACEVSVMRYSHEVLRPFSVSALRVDVFARARPQGTFDSAAEVAPSPRRLLEYRLGFTQTVASSMHLTMQVPALLRASFRSCSALQTWPFSDPRGIPR